jgi:hypothetical protein
MTGEPAAARTSSRPRNSPGAWRILAWSLVFVLSFLLFDRLLFFAVRRQQRNAFERQGLLSIFILKRGFYRNFYEIPRGTFDTLIMGSSRTQRGIHPYYLYKYLKLSAFRIAGAKCKPKFNAYFYKQYRKHAGAPRLLIYGVDYFLFKLKTNAPFLDRFQGEVEQPYSRGPSLLWANKGQNDEFLADLLESFGGGDAVEAGTAGQRHRTDLPSSAAHIDTFVGYRKLRAIDSQRPPRFRKFHYVPFPGGEGEWFLKLLQELERDQVTVVLVSLPNHVGTHESNFQRREFMADLGRLARPFANVHVLDYNRPERFALGNDEYFLDGGYGVTNSHLSDKGSRVLNRMLADDLRRIMARRDGRTRGQKRR